MAAFIEVEDKEGQLIDRRVYCHDSCAKADPLYAGWNSCHEIEISQPCLNCGEMITGTLEEGEY
jgi:hypothetical protein